MDKNRIEKYRGSTMRNENEYLLKIYLETKGNDWTKCLCNINNRMRFNLVFFEWYDNLK